MSPYNRRLSRCLASLQTVRKRSDVWLVIEEVLSYPARAPINLVGEFFFHLIIKRGLKLHGQLKREKRCVQKNPRSPQNTEDFADMCLVFVPTSCTKSQQHFDIEQPRYDGTGHKRQKYFQEDTHCNRSTVEQTKTKATLDNICFTKIIILDLRLKSAANETVCGFFETLKVLESL